MGMLYEDYDVYKREVLDVLDVLAEVSICKIEDLKRCSTCAYGGLSLMPYGGVTNVCQLKHNDSFSEWPDGTCDNWTFDGIRKESRNVSK